MDPKDKTAPAWFTIREAAEYLAIGEPTLYRWMRDGKITFRKIGDSTRFLKEDLEAFVQVFPSSKNAEEAKELCQVCHCDRLVAGQFRTTGLNYFKPSETKFWTLKDSTVKTSARMCTKCGAVMLYGDTKKLLALMREEKETGTAKHEESGTKTK